MENKVNVKFVGGVEDSIILDCPGVSKSRFNKGDIIENVPRETYEKDLKNNKKFKLVSEKPESSNKITNKKQQRSEDL